MSERICPSCNRPWHGVAGKGIDCATNERILLMDDRQFAELNRWVGRFFPGMKLAMGKP